MQTRVGQSERITLPFRMLSHRLSLFVMTALAVALLLLGRAEAYVFDEARTRVAEAAAPLMEWMSAPVAEIRKWLGGVDDYFNVYEENQRLKAENDRLYAWKSRAQKLENTIARYEALLNVQLEPGIGYVTGRVIADSAGPFVHTFIVNAGRDDGVEAGQAVVDTEGLIGRVVGVGGGASRVLLISDLNSRVPVWVAGKEFRAIMAGDNTSRPKLLYLDDEMEINEGDRVVTSGHGGMLPPGLPVGVVVRTGPEEYRVDPFARQSRIDIVRLLQYTFPQDVTPGDADPTTADDGEAEDADSQVGLLSPSESQAQ